MKFPMLLTLIALEVKLEGINLKRKYFGLKTENRKADKKSSTKVAAITKSSKVKHKISKDSFWHELCYGPMRKLVTASHF